MGDRKLVGSLLGAGLGYAVVRYNVFKGVPWDQLPVYVTNKAIALVGLLLLGLSRVVTDVHRRKHLGLGGLLLVDVHVVMSLALSWPEHYPSFYGESGRLSATAGVSVLAGALGTAGLLWLFYATSRGPRSEQRHRTSLVPGLGRTVLAFTAVHVAAIGIGGWFDLSSWPGSLPPITLLSFAVAAVLGLLPKPRSRAKEHD